MYYMQSMTALHFNTLLQTLPVNPTAWIGFALVAVLTVIMVAVIVYMLSNIIRSDNAKAWSRFQIYEALLSLVLLLAFSSLTYLFFLNPQNAFSSLNLVPTQCTGANQLFTLASCDVSVFNNASFTVATVSFWSSFIAGFIPGFDIYVAPLPTDSNINLHVSVNPLIPNDASKIFGYLFNIMLFALLFNQLQVIVISGAVLFLAVFMSLGLIARTLGFTRTFGGAMIAFGIGLGIIYPLITAMTYGFIDVNIPFLVSCAGKSIVSSVFSTCAVSNLGAPFMTVISSVSNFSTLLNAVGTPVGNIFINLGYIIAGLTIIPVMNIIIVDAFIIDFSRAIGEQMSFGQLFQRFI